MSALRRAGERAGRVDHVVDDDALLALHVADEVHDLGDVRALAALVDDGEARVRRFEYARARSTPPASGETKTAEESKFFFR